MAQLLRKLKRAVFNHDPSFCDMFEDIHSRSPAQEYLDHIRRHLQAECGDRRLTILDAGCQAGRLLIPLAQDGHQLIGLDTSGFALRRAAHHAKHHRVSVQLHRGDLAHVARWVPSASLDAAVCLEVLYLCPNYPDLLLRLADSVKPGGWLFVSHRPAIYYVASALRSGQPQLAPQMFTRAEGPSPDGDYHNWQTQDALMRLYQANHLRWRACYPIQPFDIRFESSQIPDPLVADALEAVRQSNGAFRIPTYLLVVAQKPQGV